MESAQSSRIPRGVVAATACYAVIFIAMLILRPGSEQFYTGFFNVYQILAPLFAAICGIAYARRGQHAARSQKLGWLLIGLGTFSFALGQSTWTYYESVRGIEVPFPGWADVGYLSTYPLLISGVVLLAGSTHVAGRARLLLDSAIAAGAVGMLSWFYLIQPVWAGSDLPLIGKLITVAYPLCDVAGIFGALVLLNSASSDRTLRRSFAVLGIGLVLVAFFDTTFTYYTLHNAYHTGMWSDWSLSFGWIAIGYSALMPLWWPLPAPQVSEDTADAAAGAAKPTPKLFRVVLPYVAVTVAILLIALPSYVQGRAVSNSVFTVGSMLMLLVILRQIFTLVENQHLTAQLRGFNENLEHLTVRLRGFNENLERIVAQRTHQLNALLQLTKGVNNTLQVDQVLEAAAKHTIQALQADAVVLRLLEGENARLEPGTEELFPQISLQHGLDAYPGLREQIARLPIRERVETVTLSSDSPSGSGEKWTYLRAPLLWQQRPVGMIGVLRQQGEFGATESELLESIGLEVGTALENARLYDAALEAADRDPVTGLFNHRALHQRLDKELQRAQKQEHPLSVLMMDMNNFKLFNDTYGHPVGDQVLKRVAQALQEECAPGDILGRYGGDEFLVILPATDTRAAMIVAHRLRERMQREGFQRGSEERTIPVTLSFGVAAFPDDSANRHELMTIADANLYAAKQSDEGIVGTNEIQRASREMRTEGSFGVLDAMVTAVDNKDRYTRRHSEDVTEYALWTAEEMGLSEETLRIIRIAGLLHDVGKIGVPDEILRKPGRLTDEERLVMQQHPQLGALIVGAVPGMNEILDAVRYHHERWDGKGYPEGLAGEGIPLLGRLLAVADAVSAMTTSRPYRKGLDWDVAMDEVRANIGSQFDPEMAYAFLRAVQKRRAAPRLHPQPPRDAWPSVLREPWSSEAA